MSIETGNTFGNYLVHGIDEIIVPGAISWWPSTPGWIMVGAIIGILLLVKLSQMARRWWRNRYRREALRQLGELQSRAEPLEVVSKLPFYLKTTALHAYPRKEVASLSGNNWLAYLDAHYQGPSFQDDVGRALLRCGYQSKDRMQLDENQAARLIEMSRQWISTHIVENNV